MSTEIKVPALGESVTTATVSRWIKKAGEQVAQDEAIVELETDKVTVEVPSPQAGVLSSLAVNEGDEVEVGALLAVLEAGAAAAAKTASAPAPAKQESLSSQPTAADLTLSSASGVGAFPSAAKLMTENNISAASLSAGSGKDGRITKGDVQAFLTTPTATTAGVKPGVTPVRPAGEGEERVKMTRLRKTIAQRLKDAQNTAAMLTTFNEVDMSAVMALRSEYKDQFEKKNNGIRLGFMSFFVKACVAALKDYPAANAEIAGDEIIYKNFVHMGIAVGGASGLVVPVIRHADQMNFAQIEGAITDFGKRARAGTLKIDELSGGTFSITNGGIYGSLMSTPILNPPQSAILGMHKIQERPMVINGKIEIRPMMYLALTYDHRIVDGREAVSLLVRVKEGIEDPRRLLLDL